jgi:hypothetical protein
MRRPAQLSFLRRERDASPRNTGWFVLALFVILAIALGVVLLFFHRHAPVPQSTLKPAVTESILKLSVEG